MSSPSRWLTPALLASLGLNLFLVGLQAGEWFRQRQLPAPVAAPRPTDSAPGTSTPGEALVRGVVQRALAAVPPDQRAGVEQRLGSHRPEIMRANRELRAARERVRDAFLAEPIDRAALERAYAEQRQRNLALQEATQRAVLDAMADLPLETRRAVVAALGLGAAR